MKRPRSSSTLTQAAFLVFGNAAFSGLRALSFVVIGRVAGPGVLGLVQSAFSLANILSAIGPSSLGASAGRYLPLSGGDAPRLGASINGAGALLGAGLACAVYLVLASTGSWADAVVSAFLVMTLCTSMTSRGVLVARREFSWSLAIAETCSGLLLIGAVLTGVVMDVVSAEWFIACLAVSHVLVIGLSWRRTGFELRRIRSTGLWPYVAFSVAGSIAGVGLLHGAVLFARSFGGVLEAGYLSSALLLVLPINMFITGSSQVLLPRIAAANAIGDRLGAYRVAIQVGDLGLWASGVALMGILQYSVWIVSVLLGSDFSKSAGIVIPLAVAALASAQRVGALPYMSAQGVSGVRKLMIQTYLGATSAVLIWVFLPRLDIVSYGMVAAIGYAFATLVTTFLMIASAHGSGPLGRHVGLFLVWVLLNGGALWVQHERGVHGASLALVCLASIIAWTFACGPRSWKFAIRTVGRGEEV